MRNLKGVSGSFIAFAGRALLKPAYIFRKFLIVTLACALGFTLSTPSLAQAEDLQMSSQTDEQSVSPAPVSTPEVETDTQAGDGLEIGPEIIGQPVGAVKKPSVNNVFAGDKTVSGKLTIGANQRKKKKLDVTIHVTVNRQAGGTEEKTVTIPYATASQDWSVTLDSELVVDDKVTVKQEAGGEISEGDVREVKKALNDQHKDELKMPSGEIWIEHPNANLVNEDEQAEAIEKLKGANPDIAQDFKSVKFSIDYTDHAYYEVTYTDGSTSGKIEATDLKIKEVTETSAAPTIQKVQVTDGQIIVTLHKEVAEGTKFYFINNFTDGEGKNFVENGSCKIDKSNSQEMSQAVTVNGTTVTFPIEDKVKDLELGKEFGILVKEPHKFRSCAKSEPVITTPKKVAVRDPRKLTDADKEAIDKAIRDANTVNGVSKLPDGTGDWDGVPAAIQFDDSGNVKIFSADDVAGDWDPNNDYKFVPETNEDGSVKVKDGAEPKGTIPAKDLLKNIAPKSPAIAVDTDKGEVTITPPVYEKPGEDTDLLSYTVTYKDASGAEKTVTATRTVDETSGKTTWTADNNATVDANTGVITLKVEGIEVGGTVRATAKDNGGLEGDTDKLDSDPATKKLETATVSYNGNDGTGKMDGKKLNKGSKYKILDNKFKAPENQEFNYWEIDGKEVAAATEITVTKDTVVKAVWKKSQVKVSYDANGGSGTMTGKTVDKGSEYTVLPNAFKAPDDTQEFDTWEVNGERVAPGTKIKADKDTVIKAVWKKIPVKVSYDANGGSGTMTGKTVDKGSKYTLLDNAFTAPDDTQEFDTWEVNGQKVAPNAEITVTKDTEVKAIWKKIQVKVSYDANGGNGEMKPATVDKGSEYTVLPNSFKAPDDTQEFDTWEVNGERVAPGATIKADKDTVIKAVWKKIPVKVSYDANGGKGSMDGATVDKGSEYTVLPNGFTAPDDTQEFKAWEVNGQEVAPGTKIKADKDTVIKAVWKKIPVDNPNGGSNNNGDGATKASKSPNSGKLSKTGYAGMPYHVAAMILVAGGLLIAGSKKTRKH
ncbi:InlB B-repeat-containing protein [Pauljensenia sp. UMB0895]|uniref:InlB B-repeat-containing protein n=1 Tax=Pauljensenia sp. UMB0895 TaxID=3046319 RepID=UPI00254A7910|nr:InlB B-repeat-containing protein [Pauljensenia sp. UMB0895]MDK7338781.1 InlB B-repeat-containing protein [Pauljensenia sp. UMB0895]